MFQALLYIVQASILFLARPLILSLTNICWRMSWVLHPGSSLFFTLWVTCGMCSFITFINRVFQIVRLSSISEEASSTDHDNYDSAVEFGVQKNKMNNNFWSFSVLLLLFFSRDTNSAFRFLYKELYPSTYTYKRVLRVNRCSSPFGVSSITSGVVLPSIANLGSRQVWLRQVSLIANTSNLLMSTSAVISSKWPARRDRIFKWHSFRLFSLSN